MAPLISVAPVDRGAHVGSAAQVAPAVLVDLVAPDGVARVLPVEAVPAVPVGVGHVDLAPGASQWSD